MKNISYREGFYFPFFIIFAENQIIVQIYGNTNI